MEILNSEKNVEVFRSISDSPPTHFSLEIQLFSVVNEKRAVNGYESNEFKAGGYRWKLVFYPKGNKKKNVEDHISLYLEIVGAEGYSHKSNWEVNVDFRLFLLNQNKLHYLIFEDAYTNKTCIHGAMRRVGFDKLIPLTVFSDVSNGFLVDDKCVFGAEVYVCKEKRKKQSECFEKVKIPSTCKHVSKFKKFSSLIGDKYYSEPFSSGGYNWSVVLCPRGNSGKGNSSHVSLYLKLVGPYHSGPKLLVDFKLSILDQVHHLNHIVSTRHLFTEDANSFGWADFISLELFRKKYLKKDTLLVEAELTFSGTSKASLY